MEAAVATQDEDEGTEAGEAGFRRELREGLRYIGSRRALLVCIAGLSAMVFLLLAFDTLSPLAFRELGVSRGLFGLAVAAIGLGGVTGTMAVGRHGASLHPFVLMGGGTIVVGLLVVLMGVALLSKLGLPPALWTPVLLVIGLASAAVLIASPTIIQRETPPALMGRVSATASSIPTLFSVLAPIAGSALAAWRGVGFTFALAGGALAALGLVLGILRPSVGIIEVKTSPATEPDQPTGKEGQCLTSLP